MSDTALFASNKKRLYPAMPGRSFIAVKNYTATDESELSLRKGKFVEGVLGQPCSASYKCFCS